VNLWCWCSADRYYFEGMLTYGFLFGFTLLTSPSPGVAINLGPLTLLFWRADMAKP
jgi:hypothetical protein